MAGLVSSFVNTRSEFARRWGAVLVVLCIVQLFALPILLGENRSFANLGNQALWSLLAIIVVLPVGLAADRLRGGRWLMSLFLVSAVGALVFAWVATPPLSE
jgi:uncharacterized membrane protein